MNDDLEPVAPAPGHRWYLPALFAAILLLLASPLLIPALDPEQDMFRLLLWGTVVTHLLVPALVLAILIASVPAGRRLAELCLRWPDRLALRHAALWTALAVPLCLGIMTAVAALLELLGRQPEAHPVLAWLQTCPDHQILVLALITVVVAPIAEELLFRLLLYRSLALILPEAGAICLTAFLFGLAHAMITHLLALFVLGVILQLALRRTQNLLTPILIHAGFNAIMIGLVLYARWQGLLEVAQK